MSAAVALALSAIGAFAVVCGGFTVLAGLAEQAVAAVRRRLADPLRPDRDREQMRRALARTARH